MMMLTLVFYPSAKSEKEKNEKWSLVTLLNLLGIQVATFHFYVKSAF